jgi:hypothetical protein
VRFAKPWPQELEVIVKAVGIGRRLDTLNLVPRSAKAVAAPSLTAPRRDAGALLYGPRVERRVNVDQIHRLRPKPLQHTQVVAEGNLAAGNRE